MKLSELSTKSLTIPLKDASGETILFPVKIRRVTGAELFLFLNKIPSYKISSDEANQQPEESGTDYYARMQRKMRSKLIDRLEHSWLTKQAYAVLGTLLEGEKLVMKETHDLKENELTAADFGDGLNTLVEQIIQFSETPADAETVRAGLENARTFRRDRGTSDAGQPSRDEPDEPV